MKMIQRLYKFKNIDYYEKLLSKKEKIYISL